MLFITGKAKDKRVADEDDSIEVQEPRSKRKHDKGMTYMIHICHFIHK